LDLKSTYPLPELEPSTNSDPPDLLVRREDVSGPASESVDSARRLTIGDDAVYLDYRSVGSFRIRDGDEIPVDAAPSVDPTVLRFHLLGPALAVALHQRGQLVLHASAVVVDGSAVVFLGETGAGKSTLAARCADAGHGLLADDLAAVEHQDGEFHLRPGFPSAKLDPETATALNVTAHESAPTGESPVDKDYYPAAEPTETEQYPVERVYLLAEDDTPHLNRLASPEAVAALYRHAYLRKLSERAEEAEGLLEMCGRLAAQTPVKRLSRPRDLEQLPAVIECIEADVGG
jgi:hypothetical protein